MTLRSAGLRILGIGLVYLCDWISLAHVQAASTPVPSESRQQEIRAQLDDTVGVSKAKTNTQKQEATRKLLEMALDPGVPSDELYVILRAVLPLTQETGDFESHELSTLKLTATFSTEPQKDRVELLLEYIAKCKSTSAIKPAVDKLIDFAIEEGEANRFEDSIQWLIIADRNAKRLRAKPSVDGIASTKTYLIDRQAAYESQVRAQELLKLDAESPKANLVVGQWLAVFQNDWAAALPHLAKGSDVRWQAAANAELQGSADADSQLKIADAWYDVAQVSGPSQMTVRQRAFDAYVGVEPKLTSPIAKARVSKRKFELAAILKTSAATSTKPVRPKPVIAPKPTAIELPANEPIELLDWVKLPEHAILGDWKRDQDNGLVSSPKNGIRFMVPVSIAGSYQLNMRYVRQQNDANTVSLIVPVKDRSCDVYFDSWYGKFSGVQYIDGVEGGKGTPGTFEQSKPFESHVEHEFQVIVHQSDDNVWIRSSMDGTPLVTWKGRVEQLTLPGTRGIPLSNGLGLAVWGSTVAVKSWKLRILPGGQAYRLGDDWMNPLLEVAKEPPAEVLAKCIDWKGRKYYISDSPLTLPEAQTLARRLKGRLLTISSMEEETMIFAEGRGRILWMSGWCTSDRQWRDERNRLLKFQGKWAVWQGVRQPENSDGVETRLRILTENSLGWDDVFVGLDGYHACIEWGEE